MTRWMTPPETPSTDPLHGILPGHGPTLRYPTLPYATPTPTSMSTVLWVSSAFTITTSTALMCQEPAYSCIRYPKLVSSLTSLVLCWKPFPTGFDSTSYIFKNCILKKIAKNSIRERSEFEKYVRMVINSYLKNQVKKYSKIVNTVNNQKSEISKSNFSKVCKENRDNIL